MERTEIIMGRKMGGRAKEHDEDERDADHRHQNTFTHL